MATRIWLTDEDSDISGYRVARIGSRSEAASHVRSVTNTAAGPTSGIQITRTAAGTALAWLTPALDGTDLTAAAWQFHVWALESAALANVALRFQVYQYSNAEAGTALLDDNSGTELPTTTQDYARTTGVATVTTMADRDRLVIKILLDDATAGSMATGYTATVSYNGLYANAEGDSWVQCPDTLALTAALPAATLTQVRRTIKDVAATNANLSDAEMTQAFSTALKEYGRDRPHIAVGALSGDGSTAEFGLPRLWVWGLSALREVEYPTGNTPRTILDSEEAYEILDGVLGPQPTRRLSFGGNPPDSGTGNVLVRYTTAHIHTDEQDTIPAADYDAVCMLAGAYAAEMMSGKMAASSDSTIAADSVNYRDGEQRWRSVAKTLRERYAKLVGAGGMPAVAAGRFANWDVRPAWGGERMFHPRRR